MSKSVETTSTLPKSDIELSNEELNARIDELMAKDATSLSDEELRDTLVRLESAIGEHGRRVAAALGEDEYNPLIGSSTGNHRRLIEEYNRRFPEAENEFTTEGEDSSNTTEKSSVKRLLGQAARIVRGTN